MSAPEATEMQSVLHMQRQHNRAEALLHNGVVRQATRKRRLVHGTPPHHGPHHDGSGPDNEATMYGHLASAEATVADKDPIPPWKAEFGVVFKQAMSSLKQESDRRSAWWNRSIYRNRGISVGQDQEETCSWTYVGHYRRGHYRRGVWCSTRG